MIRAAGATSCSIDDHRAGLAAAIEVARPGRRTGDISAVTEEEPLVLTAG